MYIGDSFKKIIVVRERIKLWRNEGIKYPFWQMTAESPKASVSVQFSGIRPVL